MDAHTDLAALVAENPILRSCADETRKTLIRLGRLQDFASGSVLFADDDPGGFVMFLLGGALRMVRTTRRGRRQIVCTPNCDTCGGLCLLFFGERGLAEVRGLEAGTALIVDRKPFEKLTQQDPGFCRAAWEGAAYCMLHLHMLVSQLSFNKVAERTARLILEKAAQDGDSIHLTQADLAATIGTTREVVARCLAGLQADGLIRLGRGHITVLEREKLRSQL